MLSVWILNILQRYSMLNTSKRFDLRAIPIAIGGVLQITLQRLEQDVIHSHLIGVCVKLEISMQITRQDNRHPFFRQHGPR